MKHLVLFDHPLFRQHDAGPGHPECAERLDAIVRGIRRRDFAEGVEWGTPSPATEANLRRVHTESHVRRILSLRGASEFIDGDTRVSPSSVDAALAATGACIQAVDLVLDDPEASAFCLGRPPGHHAERDAAMGFCLFNHVAAAAAYAIAEKGVKRVLIIDPDVHHGNGTQDIFYRRGDICYASIHQWPFFPGTGATSEIGAGEGKGRTVNLPFPPGMGDVDYRFAAERVLAPLIDAFNPELVIFSAGFDAHEWDPLGGMRLTSKGFVEFYASILQKLAAKRTPSFFCLEGGYSLEALEETVPAVLEMRLQEPVAPPPPLEGEPHEEVKRVVDEVRARVAL